MEGRTVNTESLFLTICILIISSAGLKGQYQDFIHNGLTREFIYYSPSVIRPGAPLVFVLHGYTDDALKIQEYSGMNAIADQFGFAVCYPRGTVDSRGNRFWNVGYSFHKGIKTDDVGFLIALAGFLQKKYDLNSLNTFATGMSNGGEMCYLLACRASSTFRAVAPVAGMMMQPILESCNPHIPVPLFEIHGINDTINRFNGDISNKDGWGAYPGTLFTIGFWSRLNECNIIRIDTIPNNNLADGSFVIAEKHINSNSGNQVWLYRIEGGGHDWPGISGNMDINTGREIWNFFNYYIQK